REEVHEVVVEEYGDDRWSGGLAAAFVDNVVEDVDRNRVRIDAVGLAVPVVEGMKPVAARLRVVARHEPIQREARGGSIPDVRPHAATQPEQRVLKSFQLR